MNPHIALEWESTFNGLRYWHMRERPEVYDLRAFAKGVEGKREPARHPGWFFGVSM